MPKRHKSKVIRLKIWPAEYDAIVQGKKTAEFRKNDRDFNVGDVLILQKFDPETKTYLETSITALITHVVYGGSFGIPEGYCMMSIKAWT